MTDGLTAMGRFVPSFSGALFLGDDNDGDEEQPSDARDDAGQPPPCPVHTSACFDGASMVPECVPLPAEPSIPADDNKKT